MVAVLAMLVWSCDRGGQFEAFNEGTEPAAAAAWVSSPSGNLTLSDPAANVTFEIEFIGTTVDQFELTVADSTNSGVLITASISGNYTGSFSLQDVVAALGTNVSDYVEGYGFEFTSTITSNGITYTSSNANTREFDAVADFSEVILVETVKLDDNSIASDGIISDGQSDTVFLEFTSGLGAVLETLPTITRTSVSGNTDDVIGEVQAMEDEDGEIVKHFFLYTAGAAANDLISFQISDASAVSADGFAMEAVDLDEVFTIDNVAPIVSGNASVGNRVLLVFNEDIASVSATLDGTAIEIDIDEDGITLDYAYDGDGTAVLSLSVEDLAGNTLNVGDFNLTN